MLQLDLLSIFAGLVAYLISFGGSVVLVFLFFRVNLRLAIPKDVTGDKRKQLMGIFSGKRPLTDPAVAPAIALGMATLCQAFLLRHGVFPAMSVVRDLILSGFSSMALVTTAVQCGFILLAIAALSVFSVLVGGRIFDRMTGEMKEREEIRSGNVPVAILFAFVLLAITIILNEGIEDLSRTLIPYGRSGVIRIP